MSGEDSSEHEDLVESDFLESSSESATSTTEKYSKSKKIQRKHKMSSLKERSRVELTLGAIVLEITEACGKAKACPPPLVNNPKNIDVFLKALIKYTAEVPPEYWKYLVLPQTSGDQNIVVEEDGKFPKGYNFAGKSDGKCEISESQVNFYRILHFCKEEDKMGWKSQRPGYLASSFQRHLENASGEKATDFGRIMCGVLVKLFDSRFNEAMLPKAKTRRALMLGCEKILQGYESLKRDVLSTRGFNMWSQKLVVPGNLSHSFPYATSEDGPGSNEILEYATDEEGEPDTQPEMTTSSTKVPNFRPNREIPISTAEALAQAEEDLQQELCKVDSFVKQAGLCQDKADGLKLRIESLKKQLSRERTDGLVVKALAENMGLDEYLQNGEEVPLVYLEVKKYWKRTCLPWDTFWSLLTAKLDNVLAQPLACHEDPGTQKEFPDTAEDVNYQSEENFDDHLEVPDFVAEVSITETVCEEMFSSAQSSAPTGVKRALESAHLVRKTVPYAGPGSSQESEVCFDKTSQSNEDINQRNQLLKMRGETPEKILSHVNAEAKNTIEKLARRKKRGGEAVSETESRQSSQDENETEISRKRRKTELEHLEKLSQTLNSSVVERN